MKLELKENMYIRTNLGKIGKLKTIKPSYIKIEIKKNVCFNFEVEDIVKASYNIIDILEEGDYVNGYYVDEILSENDCWNDKKHFHLLKFNSYFSEVDIKSIVTKEQFKSMEYKLGDDK